MDAETRETLARIIRSCVYGNLATVSADGQGARVRPVCAFLQDDFSILIPSHSSTRKIEELRRSPRAEICFVSSDHWQVRLRGAVEEEASVAEKRRLMETTLDPKLWKGFFPGGAADERYILYRLVPAEIEWMKEWELRYREAALP